VNEDKIVGITTVRV